MADVLYTTTNNIRAAIGVSTFEIKDENLIDLQLEDQLLIFFDQQKIDHETIKAEGEDSDATPEQRSLWRSLRLLSMYQCAVIVLQAGQHLLAQSMTDGGTTMSRFAKDDINTVLDNMLSQRDLYLAVVKAAGEDIPTSAYVSPLIRVSPDYDPVTGR